MFYEFKHFGVSEHFCREYGRNFNFSAHIHHCFELIIVVKGEMEVSVDSIKYIIGADEAVLVFPNQIHSLKSRSCEHILFIFSPELVKAFSSKHTNKIPQDNKFVVSQYLLKSLKELYEDSTIIKKKGALYSVCAEFDENRVYNEKETDSRNLLYNIFEFVEKNYKSDCSLEKLAKETAYSYSYLSHYFKNIVGISFNAYVNQYRISKACYILSNDDTYILNCALECGYTSLRSFNRNFKMCIGMTPQQYRDKDKK